MTKEKLPPHLVDREGVLVCSECKQEFHASETLSVSKAFAQHVRTEHKIEPQAVDTTPPAKRRA